MRNNMIPSISNEGNLASYMEQIKKFPLLEAKEEYMLAKAWKNQGDVKAAHKLVTSHLRLVAKIASGYRGYGLPLSDLISEGNIGMMHAVKRFEPEKGFRLATYAMWWIKASIQEYILRSWSLVKIGTTAAQKKLFFNLKKIKSKISAIEDGDLTPDQVDKIATELSVPHKEVISMNRRISGSDYSLNSPVTDDNSGEWQDWLEDDTQNQEASFADTEEYLIKKNILSDSLEYLNERERDIISERQLSENPLTLEELSHRYGVSRERIRQIEAKAFEKLQTKMTEKAKDINLLQYN
jgi:RNA polymerase sigma-32 factor